MVDLAGIEISKEIEIGSYRYGLYNPCIFKGETLCFKVGFGIIFPNDEIIVTGSNLKEVQEFVEKLTSMGFKKIKMFIRARSLNGFVKVQKDLHNVTV